MPGHYGPIPVADFPDEPPLFVSAKNDSDYTRECLVWHTSAAAAALSVSPRRAAVARPDGAVVTTAAPAYFDLLPSHVTAVDTGSHFVMRKKKVPPPRNPSLTAGLQWAGADAAKPATTRVSVDNGDRPRGLRSIDTTRAMLGNPHYLVGGADDLGPQGGAAAATAATSISHHKKACTHLWDWQKEHFDLRHEEHADVRSPLQIKQDNERQLERERRHAFLLHLKGQAKYQAVNRIALRAAAPSAVLNPVDQRPSTAPKRNNFRPVLPPPLPAVLPTAALRPSTAVNRVPAPPPLPAQQQQQQANSGQVTDGDATSSRRTAAPPLSARVKRRIVSLAEEFLTPRGSSQQATASAPS